MPRIRGLAAAAILLCLPGCGRRAEPTSIRIGHESDVLSLDPAAFSETATTSILSNIYEGLVSFDREMRLVPALAVSWSAPDEQTWLVRLREGVRFHDGRLLTAADVKFTLDRIRTDPASGMKGQISTVQDVEVMDDTTVRLQTLQPDPLLLNRLAYVLILPRGYSTRPVGTGPYRFVRWERGRLLEVEAFPEYWGGRRHIDRIEFLPLEEGEKGMLALRAGRVDVLRWVPETMVAQYRSIPRIRVVGRTGLTSYFLWMRSERGGAAKNPFSDRRVRQAISLAIDRAEIIRRLGGSGAAANQLVDKGVFGYISGLPDLPFDPERSRRLLKEAGYAGGFDVTLTHRPSVSVVAVAEIVLGMLGRVGIRVRLEGVDWAVVIQAWNEARLPFFIAGWRFDDGDALSFLRDCLYTRDPARNTGSSNPGYSNPDLDALIDENSRIFKEADRLKHYDKIMRVALDEMPLVPLYHREFLYAVSSRIEWEPRIDGNLIAAEMSLKTP